MKLGIKAVDRILSMNIVRKITGLPLIKRFLTDEAFRGNCSLCFGLLFNLLYAVLQLGVGILYKSVWSGALAAYYILLAVMRFELLKPRKNDGIIPQLKKYTLCGIILIFMTPVFAALLILVVHKHGGIETPGFMLYVKAAYTLCYTAIAVFGIIKYKGCKSPVISAAKTINLTVALVSVLSLETAFSARLGNESNSVFFKYIINTTCGAVCVTVLTVAIIMTARGKKRLKVLTGAQTPKGGESL